MARALTLALVVACCGGCMDAVRIAMKALELAVVVANEVHAHHLDGGVCETPVRVIDAGVVE